MTKTPPKPNPKTAAPTNAGGVAARMGFKYQDHIAAQWVIRMLGSPHLSQVECETSDDITLIWTTTTATYPEYVQVKTTDGPKKWTHGEICAPTGKSKKNSLVEKSLLCVTSSPTPRFRIVSTREIEKTLDCLKIDIEKRAGNTSIAALVAKVAKKIKGTSPQNHDAKYWVENTVWQVASSAEALIALNHTFLSRQAELDGTNMPHSQLEAIYNELLKMVDDAATASKVTNGPDKIITRQAARQWWKKHLDATDVAVRKTSKPYRTKTQKFFTELHALSDDTIKRALSSYDVRYERKVWRSERLSEYLADWLPEVTLKASELVEVNHRNLREKLKEAIAKISQSRNVDYSRLLAEILLHAVLRHHFDSEPIACKLYFQSSSATKAFGNAHIIHGETKDELWLGQSAIATAQNHQQVLATVFKNVDSALDTDFLKEERKVIVTLREPQHLLPTTLENALEHNTPIDDLLEVLCIPVLIAYDSEGLSKGFTDGYKNKLITEVSNHYQTIASQLPQSAKDVKVHVFLLPVECVTTLLKQFTTRLK